MNDAYLHNLYLVNVTIADQQLIPLILITEIPCVRTRFE